MENYSTRKQKANDFRIWRAGSSVDWDCSATEIAKDLGLSYRAVQKACKRKSWPVNDGRESGGNLGRVAADTLINSTYIGGRHE